MEDFCSSNSRKRNYQRHSDDSSSKNQYITNTSEKLTDLYRKGDLCDVCLVVGEKDYHCHRLILSAASEVFKAMLNTKWFSESGSNRITLGETADCAEVFPLFLEYLYSGKIAFSLSNVMPFYLLSDKYAVLELITHCRDFMFENMAPAAKSGHLLRWMSYNALATNNEISHNFLDFLAWNMSLLTRYQGIRTLTESILVPLLSRSDLVIHDEVTLFRIVESWLLGQYGNKKSLIRAIISKIRFSMMTYDQNADLSGLPLAQQYPETFMYRMGLSVNFHNGNLKSLKKMLNPKKPELWQFEPRLYTTDATSYLMTVEKVRALRFFQSTTYLFSTDISLARHEGTRNCEWIVDLFPSGVKILGCYLITFRGKLELPGTTKHMFRMAVTCKDPDPAMPAVKVSVLCYGNQGGVEYVRCVTQRCHKFDQSDKVIHFDGFLPVLCSESDSHLPFLVGPQNDTLKLRIVITPLPNLNFLKG